MLSLAKRMATTAVGPKVLRGGDHAVLCDLASLIGHLRVRYNLAPDDTFHAGHKVTADVFRSNDIASNKTQNLYCLTRDDVCGGNNHGCSCRYGMNGASIVLDNCPGIYWEEGKNGNGAEGSSVRSRSNGWRGEVPPALRLFLIACCYGEWLRGMDCLNRCVRLGEPCCLKRPKCKRHYDKCRQIVEHFELREVNHI